MFVQTHRIITLRENLNIQLYALYNKPTLYIRKDLDYKLRLRKKNYKPWRQESKECCSVSIKSDKVGFRTSTITKAKEGCIIRTKEQIHQEDITV